MGLLVFFMNTGFAMLETGFCRAKNAVNMLSKNLVVFFISTLAFWSFGFALMFSQEHSLDVIKGFFLRGDFSNYSSVNFLQIPLEAFFFFQAVFAGTAATIVSGALAERTRFVSFLIFTFIIAGLIYPFSGHWILGKGMLYAMGVRDFAGSLMVHTVGGMAALAGVIVIGPRVGKYNKDLSSNAILGHSIPMITLGAFILWLGWFGFNLGCTFGFSPELCAHVVVCTNAAAVMGGIGALALSWAILRKPDLSMVVNGLLGGLVSSTASCAYVNLISAHIIGFTSGCLVVASILVMDRFFHIDDPVGAISVHGIGGIWGALALGLFSSGNHIIYQNISYPKAGLFFGGSFEQLLYQLVGIFFIVLWSFTVSLITWVILKRLVGVRVSQKAEVDGLDLGEHGMEAYPGFISSGEGML